MIGAVKNFAGIKKKVQKKKLFDQNGALILDTDTSGTKKKDTISSTLKKDVVSRRSAKKEVESPSAEKDVDSTTAKKDSPSREDNFSSDMKLLMVPSWSQISSSSKKPEREGAEYLYMGLALIGVLLAGFAFQMCSTMQSEVNMNVALQAARSQNAHE